MTRPRPPANARAWLPKEVCVTAQSARRPTLIRNASLAIVWDGAGGHAYRSDVDLQLGDGQIAAIARGETLRGEDVLDGRGLLLLPGLIDIHAHPSTEPALRGVREDHGVKEQQMTGLYERSQAFRLDAEGRSAAARRRGTSPPGGGERPRRRGRPPRGGRGSCAVGKATARASHRIEWMGAPLSHRCGGGQQL